MERIGIIDLGSNTVRLVVFDVDKHIGRKLKANEFAIVLNERTVAGLSAYVSKGVFTEAGIECASDVLQDLTQAAHNIGCSRIHVFATAVLRNCANSSAASHAIEKETGLKIDVISGEEEAHLGFVGATISQKITQGVLVDIGGGSTEFTHIVRGRDLMNVSVEQGSVSSYADFVSVILPTEEECERIRGAFTDRIMEFKCIQDTREDALFGIGGSVRAVGKLCGRMHGTDKTQKVMARTDVQSVLNLLARDRSQFAHLAVKAAPERLHSLVPGCIILDRLMEAANARQVTVCKYGVREGYLRERVLS